MGVSNLETAFYPEKLAQKKYLNLYATGSTPSK